MSATEQPTFERPALDDLDYAIVDELSRAPGLTNRELSLRLAVAESTCAYRRRRLRDSGIVSAARVDLDYARLGYGMRAIITVYLSSHSREIVDSFVSALINTPHVLEVTHLTGRSDFMVTVAVRDGEQLKNFILDHITVHRSIRNTETQIVFDTHRGNWVPKRP